MGRGAFSSRSVGQSLASIISDSKGWQIAWLNWETEAWLGMVGMWNSGRATVGQIPAIAPTDL